MFESFLVLVGTLIYYIANYASFFLNCVTPRTEFSFVIVFLSMWLQVVQDMIIHRELLACGLLLITYC